MLDVLSLPPTDHELQLLPTAPGADKKKDLVQWIKVQ